MSDLISRQAAIDALEREQSHIERPITETRWFDLGLRKAQDVLSALPPAQPDLSEYSDKLWRSAYERGKAEAEPHWIPVSERLPDEKTDVLIQFRSNMAVGFWENILEYDDDVTWYANSGDGYFTDCNTLDGYDDPIAWMPLPEPYKENK